MEASQIYENILNQIQMSSLNFKLELSPFSAVISLKKSFIRDKSGNTLHSSSPKLNHLQLGEALYYLYVRQFPQTISYFLAKLGQNIYYENPSLVLCVLCSVPTKDFLRGGGETYHQFWVRQY